MSIKNNTTILQEVLNTINNLPEAGGGVELPELTNAGTASDLLSGKQLINQNGNIVTGTIPIKTSSDLTASGATVNVPAGYYASQATKSVATATQATPSVSIDANGLITASATQTAGYVAAGTKSGTKQLTTKAAATITPTKSSQTAVAKNVYTTGAVTVAAIPSQYITTTDANATASEIVKNKTAYVNGSKITGTMTSNGAINKTLDLTTTSYNVPAGHTTGGTVSIDSSIPTEIENQTELIEQIKNTINSLPEAGGVELPELTNPGTATDLLIGKQLIDQEGNIITGTMSPTVIETWTFEMENGSIITKDISIPVSVITFKIDGIQYYAVDGMTWGEWCDSSYNTDDYYNDGINILDQPTSMLLVHYNGSSVYQTNVIISNAEYYLSIEEWDWE